ncbi:glycosyltransferase family 1 protein [Asinibacterium sp. OR53]|uniref:glycosyltransferase family 4 protein n=1 Tax=Asinibacterium sp. OR53 TaxID=925409 RepID=UPI0004AF7218|nr:glycosyltransferase family 1 protein [Asinibacterium sp. OR53]
MGIVLGINASRNRSGGAKAHLCGILTECDPLLQGIDRIHVWSYKSLLDALPDRPWLIKHNPPELEESLLKQMLWENRHLPKEVRNNKCDVLLNTDAGTVCGYHPSVVMSRDMLSYEKGEMKRFGLSFARLRLIALKYVQAFSMKRADGVIFLTKYAAEVIQKTTGKIKQLKIIPHGVGAAFKQTTTGGNWTKTAGEEIRCVYVSNASMYKHQWHVVKAIRKLRDKGYNVSILLVGGGKGLAQKLLEHTIQEVDPQRKFVEQTAFMKHHELPGILATADIFVFASSCENMPNTLVEAMAGGLPVACSNRGPMPEVLKDGGVYFDPENPIQIADAIERIISDKELRMSIANKAKVLSEQYSWKRCANETLEYVTEMAFLTARNKNNKKQFS